MRASRTDRPGVKVQAVSHDGQGVLLAIRGPGEILGEISALDGGGHSATVAALGEVRAASLSRSAFLDFLQDFPRVVEQSPAPGA